VKKIIRPNIKKKIKLNSLTNVQIHSIRSSYCCFIAINESPTQ
jgi:hypothetical protein